MSAPRMDPEEKRVLVERLFTRIAPRYDWFNRLASFGLDQRWRREVLRRGEIAPGQRIVDLCTGTGDLAFLCAKRQQGMGHVVGVDRNAAMLRCAQQKRRSASWRLAWLQADAEALPFADASVDRVLIGFSTRNLSRLNIGLAEMVRVLQPQGRLIVLETGYPAHPMLRMGYQLFLFTIARTIGWALTGRVWPFTYLARSVRDFLTPQQFMDCLRELKTRVDYIPLSYGLASLYVATKP